MNTSGYQRVPDLVGADADDSALLQNLANEASLYVGSHKWAPSIQEMFLGFGIGGVIGVFLVRFSSAIPQSDKQDEWLWIICGDLPSCYVVTDDCPTPSDALATYCELMKDWATAVLNNQPLENLFPVHAEPTHENANALLSRVKFILREIVPYMRSTS